jgi:restriction system protein
MSILDFQSYMSPVLDVLSDGVERSVRSTIESVAERTGVTSEDLNAMLPSGRQPLFYNRVSWAITFLSKAMLIERTRRGYVRITDRGRTALASGSPVRMKYLEQFEEYQEFRRRGTADGETEPAEPVPGGLDPRETIERAARAIRDSVADDLLQRLLKGSPAFFEQAVVDLLTAVYGGTGVRLGRTGDGGIDGVIRQDRFGLDLVHVQAKRWTGAVGGDEIRRFAGGLEMQYARKGVFITTSHFTPQAKEFADRSDKRIALVDGRELAQLMIDREIGVREDFAVSVPAVDNEYFEGA